MMTWVGFNHSKAIQQNMVVFMQHNGVILSKLLSLSMKNSDEQNTQSGIDQDINIETGCTEINIYIF